MHRLTQALAARAHAFDHFESIRALFSKDATPSALVGRRIDAGAVPQRLSYERVPELELFELCRADEASWW